MSRPDGLTRIFLEACAIPVEERSTFLDVACAGDAGLRSEVEAMLAADDRAAAGGGTGALAAPIDSVAAEASRTAASTALPERIGPYRILGLLGEGGMGIVYRAAQTEPVRREVALKLVRAVVDSAGAVSRFELERQALAMMDHPNVARLYDAGTTDDGRPYFVMELVHGVPITEHCKTHKLALRERVELFLGVCRGVRHAHRRGVIHRDLKPSNILITQEEAQVVPKVIDFSIAKAIGEPALGTEFRTRTGQVIGTLEYMSPEQAAGRVGSIDTRSDVYALGVVLYELLTGRLPHEIAGTPLHEAVRRIVEEPPRSLRSAGSTTHGRADDDLATIVGKCLEKEPDRRYGSAADLVEDLERYLSSRPIQARPPSTIYQMRKLVGRHRAIFGSMTIALVLLIAFSVTVTYQLGIQRRERQRAENEARKAQHINTFLQEMLAAAEPAKQGGKVSIRQVLDRAAAQVDQGLKEQPEVIAELHHTLGNTYSALGLNEQARAHLEDALARYLALYGADDPETARLRIDMASVLSAAGQPAEAEAQARHGLEILRAHSPADDDHLATGLDALGNIAYGQGKLEESRKLLEESLAMRQRLGEGTDGPIARTINLLGTTLTELGRHQEGESLLRQSAEILKTVAGEHSEGHLWAVSDLAYNLGRQGRIEEAISLEQEVLAARVDLLGKDHPAVAVSHNNLGANLSGIGRCAEAQDHEKEAVRIWLLKSVDDYKGIATAWNNLGFFRQCAGDYPGALEAYESSWRLVEQHPADLAGLVPRLTMNRGILEGRLGNLREGEALVRRGLDALSERLGKDADELAGPLFDLGTVLLEEERPAEAETHLREARRLQELNKTGKRPEPSPWYFLLLNVLGRSLAAQGKEPEAGELLTQARASVLSATDAVDTRRHELKRTAELYERIKHPDVARLYRAALDHLEKVTKGQGITVGPQIAPPQASPSIASGG